MTSRTSPLLSVKRVKSSGFKKEVTYLCNRILVKHLLICLEVYAAVAQWMCYLIAKTKVSGSNPIQPIFFFGRKKSFSETHFCFRFFYRIIIFWIIALLFFFFVLFFIFHSFCSILFISFRQIQISET